MIWEHTMTNTLYSKSLDNDLLWQSSTQSINLAAIWLLSVVIATKCTLVVICQKIKCLDSSTVLLIHKAICDFNKLILNAPTLLSMMIPRDFGQLMRLWYLSHRQPAKAQASLYIRTVSPEPSLFAHMKNGGRWRVRPKITHLAPLDS